VSATGHDDQPGSQPARHQAVRQPQPGGAAQWLPAGRPAVGLSGAYEVTSGVFTSGNGFHVS